MKDSDKSRYAGLIKVVNEDKLCFPADPITLDPVGCSIYDAWAFIEADAKEVISVSEWNVRRNNQRKKGL